MFKNLIILSTIFLIIFTCEFEGIYAGGGIFGSKNCGCPGGTKCCTESPKKEKKVYFGGNM